MFLFVGGVPFRGIVLHLCVLSKFCLSSPLLILLKGICKAYMAYSFLLLSGKHSKCLDIVVLNNEQAPPGNEETE